MILNFYWPVFYFTIIALSVYLITPLIIGTNSYVNCSDYVTRLDSSDYFANLIHFYWTNFWFVLPLMVTILMYYVNSNNRLICLKPIIVLGLVTYYLSSLSQYVNFNFIGIVDNFHLEMINPLLTNSINKYHPLIFYITITLLMKLSVTNTLITNHTKAHSVSSHLPSWVNLPLYAKWVCITLSLGGWWALQEGSWGGWWNWDPSETFGLVLMLSYITLLHLKKTSMLNLNTKYYLRLQMIFFWVLYLFIQLNFDLVSHNFGTRIHQFVNSYYTYLLGLIVLTSLCFSLGSKYFFKVKFEKPVLINTLTLAVCVLILLSFLDLWINFTWLLLNLNTWNTSVNFQYWVIVIFILSLFTTYTFSVFTFFIPLLFGILTSNFKFIFVALLSLRFYNLSHRLVLYWLLLSTAYINPSVLEWDPSQTNHHYFNLKLRNIYVEFSNYSINDNYLSDIMWSFLNKTSVPLSQTFLNSLKIDHIIQSLQYFVLEFTHKISVIDYTVTPLFIILVIWFCINFIFFKKTKPIVF